MLDVTCESCRTRHRRPAHTGGTVFVCGKCGLDVRVPAPAEPSGAAPGGVENRSAQRWYYERDGERRGPVTERHLLAEARNERVKPDTLVWSEGMDDWEPAYKRFPRHFDDPTLGAAGWGIQKTVSLVLGVAAVVAVLCLGGVYAFYTPKSKVRPVAVAQDDATPPSPVRRGGDGPDRIGLTLDDVAALARAAARGEQSKDDQPNQPKTEAVNFLVACAANSHPTGTDQRVKALDHLAAVKDWRAIPALIPLLDDPDERVRQAAANALMPDAIGWPVKKEDVAAFEKVAKARGKAFVLARAKTEDVDAFEKVMAKALEGDRPRAKRYALDYYSVQKAKPDQHPAIKAALEANEPETRKAALLALKCCGPDDVPGAFERVFQRLADPETADTAVDVLNAFEQFKDDKRDFLLGKLKDAEPNARRQAARLLATGVLPKLRADERRAKTIEWFLPALESEAVADNREPLILAIMRLCDKIDRQSTQARQVVEALLKRLSDKSVLVRRAAMLGLGVVGSGPEVFAAVARFLDPDTDNDTRHTAARVIVEVDLPDKIPDDKALLETATPCLDGKTLLVRAAGLKVIAALGPQPTGDEDRLLARVADFVTKPELLAVAEPDAETQRVRQVALSCALKALVRMGKPGVKRLTKFLSGAGLNEGEKKAITVDVKLAIIERFGDLDQAVEGAEIDTLLNAAKSDPRLRPKVKDVCAKFGPDARRNEAKGSTKVGAAVVVEKLRTTYRRERELKVGSSSAFRLWLIQTIDGLDLKLLPIPERADLWKTMESYGESDPEHKALAKQLVEKIWNSEHLERLSADELDALWEWMRAHAQRPSETQNSQKQARELMQKIESMKKEKGDARKK